MALEAQRQVETCGAPLVYMTVPELASLKAAKWVKKVGRGASGLVLDCAEFFNRLQPKVLLGTGHVVLATKSVASEYCREVPSAKNGERHFKAWVAAISKQSQNLCL